MKIKSSQYSVLSAQVFPLFIGVICVLVTSLPLFHSGFFRPHDYTHAARIVEMNRSLSTGEFPVRWSENFGFGYGMPLFNFYAPLPYYVAQLPYLLTHDAIFSIKFLYGLNAVLAFTGMYLLARDYWKSSASGLISATVFSFATYRALDLYVRGAVGEVMAMVLLPFALYGVVRTKENPRLGTLITMLSLAAILLTHNLSGMISIVIVIVFGVMIDRTRKFLVFIGMSTVGAMALSAFYTFPSFFEKGYTRIDETITTGYFDFHNHFVALRQFLVGTWGYGGSVPGLGDGISFALGAVLIGLCITAVLSVLAVRKKTHVLKTAVLFVFLVGSLFMATNKSVFLWDHISILKYIQFPWRFLGFAHVFAATLAGACVVAIQEKFKLSACMGICVGVALIGLNARFFTPEKYIQNTDEFYATNPEFIRTQLSKTLNDYLPKAIVDSHLPESSSQRLAASGLDTVTITNNRPSRIDAHVTCSQVCEIDVHVFQFPGWQASIDGKKVTLMGNPMFPTYRLSVPSGDHDISVQLTDTPIRIFGNILSVTTVGTLILIYGRKLNHRRV